MQRNIIPQILVGSIPLPLEENIARVNTVDPILNRSIEHPYPRENVDVPLDTVQDIQVIPSTVN